MIRVEPTVSWRSVALPTPEDRRRDRDRWGPLLAFVITVAGPIGWAIRQGEPRSAQLAIALVGIAAVTATRRLPHPTASTLATAVAAGAATAVLVDPTCGVWLATTIPTARLTTPPTGKPLWTTLPRHARYPATLLALIAAANAAHHRSPLLVALTATATTLVPLLLRNPRALAWVDRFAHAVGHVLTTVLFSIAGLFVVVLPHLLSRLFRTDPLATVGHWDHPPQHRTTPTAAWADDRPRPPRTSDQRHLAWRHTLRTAAIPLALLLVAGAVWLYHHNHPPARDPFVLSTPTGRAVQEPNVELRNPAPAGVKANPVKQGETPAAVADDPWWSTSEFQQAQSFVVKPGGLWRHENPYRVLEFRSKYINVVDGIRTSWRAPDCGGCKRLKVWLYGGSTAWGIDQRDDHTIASELARTAHEHGMTVDVDNRGLPGNHQWLEAERFAYDLTVEPPPDLVLFYDGVNDRWWERGLFDRIFDAIWINSHRSDGPMPTGREGSKLLPPPKFDAQGLMLTREGVRRWDLARKMSKATSRASGVPVRYLWQPERYSRPFEPTEPHFDTQHENDARNGSQFAEESLAPDVIDLSRALDRTKGPIYTDDAHHNERGARVIAGAMFDAIEKDLRSLEASR